MMYVQAMQKMDGRLWRPQAGRCTEVGTVLFRTRRTGLVYPAVDRHRHSIHLQQPSSSIVIVLHLLKSSLLLNC